MERSGVEKPMNSPRPTPLAGSYEIISAMAAEKTGSSIWGRVYAFPAPRGPSKLLYFENDLLVFRSLGNDRQFSTTYDKVVGLPILSNEMQIIAWCSK